MTTTQLLERDLKAWDPTNAEIIMGALYSLAQMIPRNDAPSELVEDVLNDCIDSLTNGKPLWGHDVHMKRETKQTEN